TGDGKPAAESACGCKNTMWHVFEDYPISGYSYPYCNINTFDLCKYVGISEECTAAYMARDHAKALKGKGIIVYCIGLGPHVSGTFLKKSISSWDIEHPKKEYYFKSPNQNEMKRIFNQVAMEIKEYVYLVK
ncbi:MAG: hypothetical protein U9Q89_08130, partial [Thermodesulfobacteriota bacterium]|nr:hypothetical protein [Thermodesulfobacteriota bacterium]